MKKVITAMIFTVLLGGRLFGEITPNEGDSVVEFSSIVFVGQMVEITPFSVVFENTLEQTKATNEQIKNLIEYYNTSTDFRSHGFANALEAISVQNGKMRISFYLDNVTKVFSNDVNNYMKFIPLYYVFRNNIEQLKVPQKVIDELKKKSLDYYLNLPLAKEIMTKSWMVGVFKIDPETSKLVYYASRVYNDIDKLRTDQFAAEYRVYDIIKSGLTMTMTKARIVGQESKNVKKDDENGKDNVNDKKQFYNEKHTTSGQQGK